MDQEIDIIDGIQERIDRDGRSNLTAPERNYHAVWYLLAQMESNGDLVQFFSFFGWLAPDAVAGLKAMGAVRTAAILASAIEMSPSGLISEQTDVRRRAEESLTQAQGSVLTSLRDQFCTYPDNLSAETLTQYARAHEAEFLGPRTLLDMWRSKRQRGADTTPERIARKIDLSVEAEKDRAYSSRPCPECNYPSPDYRMTCKRCGFPHGKVK